MRSLSPTRWSVAAALACGLVAGGCSSDSTGPSGTVKDYFTAVQAVVNVGPTAPAQPSVGVPGRKAGPSFNRGASFNLMPPQTVTATYHSGTPPT